MSCLKILKPDEDGVITVEPEDQGKEYFSVENQMLIVSNPFEVENSLSS